MGNDLLGRLLRTQRAIASRVLSAAATHVLVFGLSEWDTLKRLIGEVTSGRIEIDGRLVLSLFNGIPKELRIEVLDSLAASHVSGSYFFRMFRACYYYRGARQGYWLPRVARALGTFLSRNPREARRYVREMRALVVSNDNKVAILGMRLVPYLRTITLAEVRAVISSCTSRVRALRLNAFNALAEVCEKRWRFMPTVVKEVLSDRLDKVVRRHARTDRDSDVRDTAARIQRLLQR